MKKRHDAPPTEETPDEISTKHLTLLTFIAVLDANPCPSYIVDEVGQVVYANSVGALLLDRDSNIPLSFPARVASGGPDVRSLDIPEGPPRWLLVLNEYGTDLELRLYFVREQWALTPKQLVVLERVVRGDLNKIIASDLSCSESAVEMHVTALLRAAKAKSRTQLVARFWMM